MSGFAHTAGPWESADEYVTAGEEAELTVADCEDSLQLALAEAYANAARIVSTVNACDAAGLTNAALDAGVIGQLVDLVADVLVAKDEFDQGRDHFEGRAGEDWVSAARATLALARGDAS